MHKRILSVILALALAIAAGCGDDDDDSGQSAGQEQGKTATVKVATIPTAAAGPLFVGIDQGFFKQEGLQVKTQFAEGGAAIIPAVQSGEVQFGFGNTVSLFIARERGLQLPLVAAGQVAPTDEDKDETAVMVPAKSRIRSIKDLAGTTIGVNTLRNVSELSISAGMDNAGVDSKTVKYTEVPFPEALPTIGSGDVDAAFFGEPFTTLGEQAHARVIFRPFSAGVPGGQIGAYFASESYVDDNGDIAERFARAVERSNQYVIDHPDELRTAVPKFTEVPADVAKEMRLPVFVPKIDPGALQKLADLSQKYGLTKERVDTADMLFQPDK